MIFVRQHRTIFYLLESFGNLNKLEVRLFFRLFTQLIAAQCCGCAAQLSANATVTFPPSNTHAARGLFIWTSTVGGIQSALSRFYLCFNVKVGLHQGSAISPRLFIITMDVFASEIDTEPPWAMLFADNLVLCETSKTTVERELEIWRDKFERHGLRVSWTKTAYMPCNDYDNNPRNYEEIQPGDDKLNTVTTFKYLGSIFDSNGGAEQQPG